VLHTHTHTPMPQQHKEQNVLQRVCLQTEISEVKHVQNHRHSENKTP